METGARAEWPAIGVAARAVVTDERGRVLLIRRASDVRLDPDRWELPGGKMDYGEELAEALRREVAEETGLSVEVGAPFHVAHFMFEPFWVTCVVFACTHTDGEVRLSEEHSDFVWATPADLGGLDLGGMTQDQLDAFTQR